jgi:hypothetical protein
MASIESARKARARRSYEWGRLRFALRRSWIVLPMTMLSLLLCEQPTTTLVAGALLLACTIGLLWRGQACGRAVLPGLLVGLVPLLLPVVLRTSGHCCVGTACLSNCFLACIGGGALAGGALGVLSSSEKEARGRFLAAAALVTVLAGTLGCAVMGAAGVAGMIAGVVASSMPVAVLARQRG